MVEDSYLSNFQLRLHLASHSMTEAMSNWLNHCYRPPFWCHVTAFIAESKKKILKENRIFIGLSTWMPIFPFYDHFWGFQKSKSFGQKWKNTCFRFFVLNWFFIWNQYIALFEKDLEKFLILDCYSTLNHWNKYFFSIQAFSYS